ncbi:MAG TPA: prolipoprotein diacylglyceryl transferase [Clostridiales bacterium]|jgi:phosphatidylglycerol:prolipoprotein diacylglycerol transferase|nr:prolipoprotein diacylglyceryl transferase [Clostridiales bacterium]
MTTVSFPGFGIGEFTMNPRAFSFTIFGRLIEVHWYGILIAIGFLLAIFYAAWRSRQEGIILDDLLDIGIFTIIFGIVGARLYYVLTYGVSNFVERVGRGDAAKVDIWKTFVNLIATWEGGLAIYGGVIAGTITIYFVCRRKKINPLRAFDAIAPGVMLGQIIGRWGNFINGEAYGYEVAAGSPLYVFRMGLLPNIDSATVMHYYHPTFLYESAWNLLGFILINFLYKNKKFDGQIALSYFTWYGFGRMFIEGLRTDSLYVGVFRISQVVGFVCFVAGAALIVRGLLKAKKAAYEAADYEPVYPRFKKRANPESAPVPGDGAGETGTAGKLDVTGSPDEKGSEVEDSRAEPDSRQKEKGGLTGEDRQEVQGNGDNN